MVKRVVVLVVAVVAAILCAVNTVRRVCCMTVERSDFPVFLAAGQAVLEGTDLYGIAPISGRGSSRRGDVRHGAPATW